MLDEGSAHFHLAQFLAGHFQRCEGVQAIALGGSQAGGLTDSASDIDLYVFTTRLIPLSQRQAILQLRGALRADMDLQYWDPGDEWIDLPSGIEVDVMYWEPAWVTAQVERVVLQHQAWMGYTTCHWHTIRHLQPLFDPTGWLRDLQTLAAHPYPEPLRRAIVAKNHAILRNVIPAYEHQIARAARRGDLVSLNHRVAALLASYFDVLFALNRQTHPGEKKLIRLAEQNCPRLPEGMAEDVQAVLQAAGHPQLGLEERVARLLDRLDALLAAEGFDPRTSLPLEAA